MRQTGGDDDDEDDEDEDGDDDNDDGDKKEEEFSDFISGDKKMKDLVYRATFIR